MSIQLSLGNIKADVAVKSAAQKYTLAWLMPVSFYV